MTGGNVETAMEALSRLARRNGDDAGVRVNYRPGSDWQIEVGDQRGSTLHYGSTLVEAFEEAFKVEGGAVIRRNEVTRDPANTKRPVEGAST